MISRELETEILRLCHAEGWRIGTVSRQLRVHRDTVRRVLAHAGLEPPLLARPSMIEPYVPFIQDTFAHYPSLRASRLTGWCASAVTAVPPITSGISSPVIDHAPPPRRTCACARCRANKARWTGRTSACSTRPGTSSTDGLRDGAVVLAACVPRFYLNAAMPSFLHGHVAAFNHFGAVPRTLLYDNLRSAVLERRADAIRFHPTLLELAAWYRFQPRPVAGLAATRRAGSSGRSASCASGSLPPGTSRIWRT